LSLVVVHLPRFINEIEEHFHATQIRVVGQSWDFHCSFLTHSEYIIVTASRISISIRSLWFHRVDNANYWCALYNACHSGGTSCRLR
jgi:hypothetical protein